MQQAEHPYRVFHFPEVNGHAGVTLLGPTGVVSAADKFLEWMSFNDYSQNTVEGYARDLKQWFNFLHAKEVEWDSKMTLEVLTQFVFWLRKGDVVDAHQRIIPIVSTNVRRESTIRRKLAAVYAFYDLFPKAPLAKLIHEWMDQHRGSRKSRRGGGRPVSAGSDPDDGEVKQTLTRDQMEALIDACDTYRDRLLLALPIERGLRVGAMLGMRHTDFLSRQSLYKIVPRTDNVNGAHSKVRKVHVLPLNERLIDLHRAYMHDEYGELDCDYLFVNFRGKTKGEPMTYNGLVALREKLIKRTKIYFRWHMLRRSCATNLAVKGVALVAIQKLLCHASPETTSDIYVQFSADRLREALDGHDQKVKFGERRPGDEVTDEELRTLLNTIDKEDDEKI